ncbi:MAG: exopolysaccharide biosynthesis polyprenyl glycosylphosphotransferase [Acidimicrobiia bacterium]
MRRVARLLLVAGTAAAVLALSKAHAVRHEYDFTASPRFGWALAYIVLLVAAAYGIGLPDLTRTRRSAAVATVGSTLAAALAISVLQLLFGSALLPRFVVFGTPAVLTPLYALCAALANDGRARDARRDRLILVGGIDEASELTDELAENPERPAIVAAVLSPEEAATVDGREPLVEAAARHRASAVVLDRRAQNDDSIVAQAASLHATGVRVRTLSLCFDEWLGKLPISELERISLMFDIGEVHRARYGRLKRIADIAAGAVGMVGLAMLLPFVLVGNLVANRGPLFYRQPRVGKHGRPFHIYKFRTMAPDGGGTAWTTQDDPRITPFGAWLRRSHLDELPQALNMLRGDLSIVGPRPEQPQYVEELTRKIPFYNLRHLVRPGLTGWAQVKYPYGSTEADALEKLQYEFYYLRHQSLGLDARILGRTIRTVVGRKGR